MVPPVTAISFFERRYRNDPLILQYAHRVLEQHPVDLTFFFVPQVVQALRYDDFGVLIMFTLLFSFQSVNLHSHRLRFQLHFRDCQDIAAVLPPDHLEHESKLFQR